MCVGCKYCKWLECTYDDFGADEPIESYDETNCPHYVVYWADENDPYESEE